MAVTVDGVQASRSFPVDMIATCETCPEGTEEQGFEGRARATSWARRHVAKTGHTVGLSKTVVVKYRPGPR
jgi:hypothetical protein